MLHSFFGFALKNKYVAANPVTDITIRVECGDPGILTVEQAQCLLFAAQENPQLELGPFVTLGFFCGIRSEELSRLDWREVNFSEGFVTISKRIAKKRRIRNRSNNIAKRFRKLIKAARAHPNGAEAEPLRRIHATIAILHTTVRQQRASTDTIKCLRAGLTVEAKGIRAPKPVQSILL